MHPINAPTAGQSVSCSYRCARAGAFVQLV